MTALGLTNVGWREFDSSTNDADVANELYTHWNSYQNAIVDVFSPPAGSPLIGGHTYTVVNVWVDANGNVTSIDLRNPWGEDDTSGNPFVSVTPAQLGACGTIRLAWGNA